MKRIFLFLISFKAVFSSNFTNFTDPSFVKASFEACVAHYGEGSPSIEILDKKRQKRYLRLDFNVSSYRFKSIPERFSFLYNNIGKEIKKDYEPLIQFWDKLGELSIEIGWKDDTWSLLPDKIFQKQKISKLFQPSFSNWGSALQGNKDLASDLRDIEKLEQNFTDFEGHAFRWPQVPKNHQEFLESKKDIDENSLVGCIRFTRSYDGHLSHTDSLMDWDYKKRCETIRIPYKTSPYSYSGPQYQEIKEAAKKEWKWNENYYGSYWSHKNSQYIARKEYSGKFEQDFIFFLSTMTPEEEKTIFAEENPGILCNLDQFDEESLQAWFENFFLTELPKNAPPSPVIRPLQDPGPLSLSFSRLDSPYFLAINEEQLRRKYQHILGSKQAELVIVDNKEAYLLFKNGFKRLVS